MEKVVIHQKTFCKDFNRLLKAQVAAMRKNNPELDRRIKEYESKKAVLEKVAPVKEG